MLGQFFFLCYQAVIRKYRAYYTPLKWNYNKLSDKVIMGQGSKIMHILVLLNFILPNLKR